jgi:hypothetical protein
VNLEMGRSGIRRMLASSARDPRLRLTTPEILRTAFVAILGLSILAFFVSYAAIGRFQAATTAIGDETKPAAVLAEKLSVTLADMDAQVTDSSLGNGQAWTRYLADIETAVNITEQATRTVHTEDAEAEALRSVQLKLRNYYQMIGGASVTSPDIFVSNEQLAMTTTLWASRLMRQDIIPQAQKAAELATAKLNEAYAEFRRYTVFSTAFALLPVVMLLALLVAAQLFITRRTRRLVNIPLALATLVLLSFVGWFSYVAESGRSAILTAKEDSYDDLQALYRAKVTAYLMKADESMWLFELRKARFEQKRLRGFYARSFGDSARQLIDVGHIADFPGAIVEGAVYADPVDHPGVEAVRASLAAAEKQEKSGRREEAMKLTPRIPGILGSELRHFEESGTEWEAAYDAVTNLLSYLEIDRKIRVTALDESRDKAVQLSIGGGEGGANWAFNKMDGSLDRMISTENQSFDAPLAQATWNLSTLPTLLAGVLVFTVLFAGWGLWQRYREYR